MLLVLRQLNMRRWGKRSWNGNYKMTWNKLLWVSLALSMLAAPAMAQPSPPPGPQASPDMYCRQTAAARTGYWRFPNRLAVRRRYANAYYACMANAYPPRAYGYGPPPGAPPPGYAGAPLAPPSRYNGPNNAPPPSGYDGSQPPPGYNGGPSPQQSYSPAPPTEGYEIAPPPPPPPPNP